MLLAACGSSSHHAQGTTATSSGGQAPPGWHVASKRTTPGRAVATVGGTYAAPAAIKVRVESRPRVTSQVNYSIDCEASGTHPVTGVMPARRTPLTASIPVPPQGALLFRRHHGEQVGSDGDDFHAQHPVLTRLSSRGREALLAGRGDRRRPGAPRDCRCLHPARGATDLTALYSQRLATADLRPQYDVAWSYIAPQYRKRSRRPSGGAARSSSWRSRRATRSSASRCAGSRRLRSTLPILGPVPLVDVSIQVLYTLAGSKTCRRPFSTPTGRRRAASGTQSGFPRS